ncbi:polysaccharide deacetylase family protein [Halorubrum ezzemoulense]|uniref:polysaccharide deacetylase family protein n=1 Tax=Halorubrum ezzemoulense TaxID=337243 RepID=UPI00232D3C8D|nr:polysaccharide deacetylase family protein [Halorubrum ezzemoulense]
MDRTEVEAAIEYAEIAAEYDVPVTLFVTGKAAEEEPERVKRLAAMENVEIGGHNYWAFDTLVHKGWRGLTGSWNGPRPFQRWEIRKTIETFAELGIEITSWRNHAYRHDKHTASLLSEAGIKHFSDVVAPKGEVREEDGLTVVPINTPPDHEHVYHAFRTPSFVAGSDFEGPFGEEAHAVEEWLDWILEYIEEHNESGLVAVVLAHPSCMSLADEIESFEDLCKLAREQYSPAKIHSI